MAFRRRVVCGIAITSRGSTTVAVIYPTRGKLGEVSVATPANPGPDGAIVGNGALKACRRARQDPLPDWRQAAVKALADLLG